MRHFIFYILTIGSFLFLNGCRGKEQTAPLNIGGIDTVSVSLQTAGKSDFVLTKSFAASLEGEEQANVTSKLAERITAIKIKVGDPVKEGQILVTLDKAGATSQYFQTEAAFKNAAKDLDRMQALLKEGAVSRQMVDGAQTQYTIAKANFEAAKSMTELAAPIGGIITAVNARIGDNANPAVPIITIAKIGKLKAIFNTGEGDVAKLAVGKSVSITSDAKQSLLQKGSIVQIAKSADDQSRSFEVKALFANTGDLWLKPGMFCKVTVEMDRKTGIIKLPQSAIIIKGTDRYAYIVQNGKAVERRVQIGLSDGTMSEITDGIAAGESVVIVGANQLQNNTMVRIQNK